MNDKFQMTNDERNPNSEIQATPRFSGVTQTHSQGPTVLTVSVARETRNSSFELRHSFVLRHSSFVILFRHIRFANRLRHDRHIFRTRNYYDEIRAPSDPLHECLIHALHTRIRPAKVTIRPKNFIDRS